MGFGGGGSGLATASTTVYEVLDNHVAAGAEASYTFTPTAALTFITFSKIVVELLLRPTGAAFTLGQVLNGVGAGLNSARGFYWTGSGIVNVMTGLQPYVEIANPTIFPSNTGFGTVQISSSPVDVDLVTRSEFNSDGSDECQFMSGGTYNVNTITSIRYQTSVSTWATGSRITIYGVLRIP